MLFTRSLTVETTHTEAVPLEETLQIAHGIITQVYVFFPAGCNGLVFARVKYHERAIFPSTPAMFITGSGFPIQWGEYYEVYQEPYELKLVGWAQSTTYAHVVTFGVVVLPRKAIVALAVTDAIKAAFSILSPKRIFRGGKKAEG